jgi:MFS family permease
VIQHVVISASVSSVPIYQGVLKFDHAYGSLPVLIAEEKPRLGTGLVEEKASEVSVRRLDFPLLWSGSAVSLVGAVGATTAGPLLALSSAGSPVLAGWVTFAGTIPGLLFHLPAGVLVDRLDRRLMMLVSQIILAVVGAVMAGALLMGVEPIPVLLIGATLQGTCVVSYSMAEIAFIPRIVASRKLGDAMGKNEAREHVANLMGNSLGGALVSVNRALPFLVEAFSSIVCLVGLTLIRGGKERIPAISSNAGRSVFKGIWESLGWLLRDSYLRLVLVVFMATNFLFRTVSLLLMVMAKRAGLPVVVIGVLLAAPGIGGAAGASLAPRVLRALLKKRTPGAFVTACVWGWFGLLLIIAVSRQWPVWMCAWGGVGFIGAHMNVALATYQVKAVPSEMLGRVISANSFIAQGVVVPAGALSGAYLISVAGVAWSAAVVVLAMLCFAGLVTFRRFLLGRFISSADLDHREGVAQGATAGE